jgi:phenylalanyl-tRNA synthetase alpha subunit
MNKDLELRIIKLEKLLKNEALNNVNVDHIITEVEALKDRMMKLSEDIEDAIYAVDDLAKKDENNVAKETAKSLKELRKVGEDLNKVADDIRKAAITDQLSKIKEALNKPAEVKQESKRLNRKLRNEEVTDPIAHEVYDTANNIRNVCQRLAVTLHSQNIISPEVDNALSLCEDDFPVRWFEKYDRIINKRR